MNAYAIRPARSLPSPQQANLRVLVFDTYPDLETQQWLQQAYEQLLAEAGDAMASEMRFFWSREVGVTEEAEFYPSRFLVRSVVVVVDADQAVHGMAIAHGSIRADLIATPEGPYASLSFSWPLARAWGKGRGEFVLAQAQNRCIEQYEAAALPLFDTLKDIESRVCPLCLFDDNWDASAQPLRLRLTRNLLNRIFLPRELPRVAPHALRA